MKEYRFDHENSLLSLWRQVQGLRRPSRNGKRPPKGPVYDPLTLLYNFRLGAFGPLPGGATLKVMVLANPKPQEMVFMVGPVTDTGRKVTMDRRRPESKTVNHYYWLPQPGAGAHPGLDPGARVRQAHGAFTEPRRDQEGGAPGPASLLFSQP